MFGELKPRLQEHTAKAHPVVWEGQVRFPRGEGLFKSDLKSERVRQWGGVI